MIYIFLAGFVVGGIVVPLMIALVPARRSLLIRNLDEDAFVNAAKDLQNQKLIDYYSVIKCADEIQRLVVVGDMNVFAYNKIAKIFSGLGADVYTKVRL